MERHDTRIDDGMLYIEVGDDDVEIGELDDICDLVGGESYTLEYDEDQRKMAWLDTDPDGAITFDVRETLADLDYNDTFVEKMTAEPIDREAPEGYPVRTVAFADLMVEIWESKGNMELE